MPESTVVEAAGLLKRHYGSLPDFGTPGEWSTLVRVVLDRGNSTKKSRDWAWLDDSPLRTPGETAAHSKPLLEEVLGAAGHAASHAGVLHRLAEWWLLAIGESEAAKVLEQRSLEAWQNDLRAIRGVNWDLADRILLFVGGRAVYPLDRGSLRIAARHGWMEMTVEYDDWQVFFVAGLRDADVELAQFSRWSSRLGREFCGAKPKCDDCPLKAMLPARGPIPFDDECR